MRLCVERNYDKVPHRSVGTQTYDLNWPSWCRDHRDLRGGNAEGIPEHRQQGRERFRGPWNIPVCHHILYVYPDPEFTVLEAC